MRPSPIVEAICSTTDRIVEITDKTIEALKQNDVELAEIAAKLREPVPPFTEHRP